MLQTGTSVRDPSAGQAAPSAIGDGTPTCNFGWTCLWVDAGFYGRKYQWSDDGSKNLGDWGIRDVASSVCNNDEMGGMTLYDWRTGMPDPEFIVALGGLLLEPPQVRLPLRRELGRQGRRARHVIARRPVRRAPAT
ncbi:peptidase inhibitor family I36 protein [Streptomyces sp. NBC_00158]|uniref:peptidase inhibitor family I36 protein n=1 Tax=Streptomyces sp. NBC_00158 TaxID=2903627 RepID=UPI0032546A6F